MKIKHSFYQYSSPVRNKQNAPVIIKYPFWKMTAQNPDAVYACVNFGEAFCPQEIKEQSICVDGDIGVVLQQLIRNGISITIRKQYD